MLTAGTDFYLINKKNTKMSALWTVFGKEFLSKETEI